jgi:hypothetical protein
MTQASGPRLNLSNFRPLLFLKCVLHGPVSVLHIARSDPAFTPQIPDHQIAFRNFLDKTQMKNMML